MQMAESEFPPMNKAAGAMNAVSIVKPALDCILASLRTTMPFVAESTGEENANLYKRGVSEGSRGELLDASELLELLDVFGEDGVRSYLVGYLEGVDDAMEEEDE